MENISMLSEYGEKYTFISPDDPHRPFYEITCLMGNKKNSL
jgi:hypothetical protein